MRERINNSIFKYVLIACLALMLLVGQVFKLHMHIQHDEANGSPVVGSIVKRVVDVHAITPLHGTSYDSHHQDSAQSHHHFAEIGVSSDGFVKKIGLLNITVFLFLILSVALCLQQLRRIRRKYNSAIENTSSYYFIHPPLRAPPV
jgi:DMSO reductase anchor subunit